MCQARHHLLSKIVLLPCYGAGTSSMEGPGLSNFFDSVRSRIRLCLLL